MNKKDIRNAKHLNRDIEHEYDLDSPMKQSKSLLLYALIAFDAILASIAIVIFMYLFMY